MEHVHTWLPKNPHQYPHQNRPDPLCGVILHVHRVWPGHVRFPSRTRWVLHRRCSIGPPQLRSVDLLVRVDKQNVHSTLPWKQTFDRPPENNPKCLWARSPLSLHLDADPCGRRDPVAQGGRVRDEPKIHMRGITTRWWIAGMWLGAGEDIREPGEWMGEAPHPQHTHTHTHTHRGAQETQVKGNTQLTQGVTGGLAITVTHIVLVHHNVNKMAQNILYDNCSSFMWQSELSRVVNINGTWIPPRFVFCLVLGLVFCSGIYVCDAPRTIDRKARESLT